MLEKRFLFIFFEIDGSQLILKKVKFWAMPYQDKLEAEKVWRNTKNIIKSGRIIKEIAFHADGKQIRKTNFPRKSQNRVAHVRPHAKNSQDTDLLPVADVLT